MSKLTKGVSMENLPLHRKYRPQSFEQIIGNKALLNSLATVIEKNVTTFLFQGPSGAGKTTIARIIAKELGARDVDIKELNISDTRGIDAARTIIENARFKAFGGVAKVYILDECFSENTLVRTIHGNIPIQNVKKGDLVFNIKGASKVSNTFKNKVPLNRVMKLNLSNGNDIICSKEHLFLTENGWKKAKSLSKKDLILEFDYIIMESIELQRRSNYDNEEMPILRERLSDKKFKRKVLFDFLLEQIKKKALTYSLWVVRKINRGHSSRELHKKILFGYLCGKMEYCETRVESNPTNSRNKKKTKWEFVKIQSIGERFKIKKRVFKEDEEKQPDEDSRNYREGAKYEEIKWYFTCLERSSRGQWSINRTTKTPCLCFGMANGSGYKNRAFPIRPEWIPDKLQSRYRKQEVKISNRSRRTGSQIEEAYIARCKENKKAERVRVESIEVYKPGSTNKSFESIIGDKERDQGFIEFYDLEVENHPSYFANDILVHNCHRSTMDFQNAMLKILEEPPKNTYFILCTTEPEKLLKTIRNRCTTYQVRYLTIPESAKLINRVIIEEKRRRFPKEAIQEIAFAADGCPRDCLKILDSVIDIEDDKELVEAIKDFSLEKKEVIDLCRALLAKKKWKEVSGLIKSISDEPENTRYAVLGYMASVLLNKPNDSAAIIIEEFKDSFMYTKRAGLVSACYAVCNL